MANLGTFEIDTKGKYIKVADAIKKPLLDDTTYVLQATSAITLVSGTSIPKAGGFIIPDLEKTGYTKPAGEDLYINTGSMSTSLNISENL